MLAPEITLGSPDGPKIIRRKRPKYKGVLNKPIPVQISVHLDKTQAPWWYPLSASAWTRKVEQIQKREVREWQRRIEALGKYYGVSIDKEPDPSDCWHRLVWFSLRPCSRPRFRAHRSQCSHGP